MIYFAPSVYDINGSKYLKTNFETLELQDFTNIFWNFIRGNFPEKIPCFLASCLRSGSLSICKNWSGIPSGSSVKYSGKSKAKLAVNRDFAIEATDIQLSYSPSSLMIYC